MNMPRTHSISMLPCSAAQHLARYQHISRQLHRTYRHRFIINSAYAGALAAMVSEPARARGQMLEEWAASAACEQKLQEIASAVKPRCCAAWLRRASRRNLCGRPR